VRATTSSGKGDTDGMDGMDGGEGWDGIRSPRALSANVVTCVMTWLVISSADNAGGAEWLLNCVSSTRRRLEDPVDDTATD
jgi:hypothetical protein